MNSNKPHVSQKSNYAVGALDPALKGGVCRAEDQYEVKSNRESGLGRYDVLNIPKNPNALGIIMEFKKVGRFEKITLEMAVESALKQIEEKHYQN